MVIQAVAAGATGELTAPRPKGLGCEQEAGAVVVVQPVGEGGEVTEFAEVDAEFEEAVFMDGQAAHLIVGGEWFADGFDGQVV